MYCNDPEIRRFAIESLMQAASKTRGPVRLTKSQYEMLAALRRYLRQYFRFSELAVRDEGLTPRQYEALLSIKGFSKGEKVTIGKLADLLQIAHHRAVGLVDRSVDQNLVAREPDVEGRRQMYVKLARRGEEVLEQLAGVHRPEIRRLGPRLELILGSLMVAKE
jgi:DNA-binding MarR family transcriptional regulator